MIFAQLHQIKSNYQYKWLKLLKIEQPKIANCL
jgi:hypothetical protein